MADETASDDLLPGARVVAGGNVVYCEFEDSHGKRVTVMEASSVAPRCWIYLHGDVIVEGELQPAGFPGKQRAAGYGSANLSVADARHVRDALDRFIAEYDGDDESDDADADI